MVVFVQQEITFCKSKFLFLAPNYPLFQWQDFSTGQMQEETQELLDEYNELYNWSYNDMCDFIESYEKMTSETTMKHIRDLLMTMDRKWLMSSWKITTLRILKKCIKVNIEMVQNLRPTMPRLWLYKELSRRFTQLDRN